MDDVHLARMLTSYRPNDARESSFVQRMLELLRAPAPFDRSSFDPGHFTASAFVLDPSGTALLLVFHRKLELWLQPGGHIDPVDQDIVAAARRELAEEVGVYAPESIDEAILDVDIHPIPARKTEPAHQHFDVRFAFRALSRDLVQSDEVASVRWVELAEVKRVTRDVSVLRAAAKLSRLAI